MEELTIFQPGDRVHWTQTRSGRHSLTMTRVEGVIKKIEWGEIAIIQTSVRAKDRRVHVSRLRRPGETSQITEFIEAVRDASEKES